MLILASSSPRRLQLLQQIGVTPGLVRPAAIDETAQSRELPRLYARRMALEKARAVAATHPKDYVLAADTVVACGRRILPKAEDKDTARACLELLSGRRHRVIGGVCLIGPGGKTWTETVETIVHVKRLQRADIDAYLQSGEWEGKAGGYAIQGAMARFIPRINGCYFNVVGLPIAVTAKFLAEAKIL